MAARTAFALQSERMRRIGVPTGADADDLDMHARIGAFEDGLKQLGWTNGQIESATLKADYEHRHEHFDTLSRIH
jgi:hypothetical protein